MSNSVARKFELVPSLYAADGRRKYLNQRERLRLIEVLGSLEPARGLFGLTLAWTGARISEALALTPASIQVDAGLIAIKTLKRRHHCVREVPIPPLLVSRLDAHFGISAAHSAQVCGSRLWGWRRETGWRIVKRAMQRAGIEGLCASPKGLRHGFGVCAIQAGVPLNLVQRWLGHARLSTTAIYADACGPEERDIARRLWLLGDLDKL